MKAKCHPLTIDFCQSQKAILESLLFHNVIKSFKKCTKLRNSCWIIVEIIVFGGNLNSNLDIILIHILSQQQRMYFDIAFEMKCDFWTQVGIIFLRSTSDLGNLCYRVQVRFVRFALSSSAPHCVKVNQRYQYHHSSGCEVKDRTIFSFSISLLYAATTAYFKHANVSQASNVKKWPFDHKIEY